VPYYNNEVESMIKAMGIASGKLENDIQEDICVWPKAQRGIVGYGIPLKVKT